MKHIRRTNKVKNNITTRVVFALVSILLIASCLIILYPYLYCIFGSIRNIKTFTWKDFLPIPTSTKDIDFSNYVKAFSILEYEESNVLDMLLNSLWYSLGMTFIGLLYATTTAYVCAKYTFPGRKFIYVMALVMMIVPIIGATASNISFTKALGGYDNPFYVIINAQTIGGSFIIIYACFKAVDWSYAESAFIDGSGHFKTFFKIMLPQLASPLSALALTNFIAAWSDADTSLLYFPTHPTLGTGIYYISDKFIGDINFPKFLAALVLVMLPSIILFSIFQKKMMDIQMGGALKG